MTNRLSTKNVLGKVKGLGSAHEGTKHWLFQRITSVVLVPLVIWLAISLIHVAGLEREFVIAWFGHPFSALALASVVGVGVFHAVLGLTVVVEDYVHTEWAKFAALFVVRIIGFSLAGVGFISAVVMVFIRFMGTN